MNYATGTAGGQYDVNTIKGRLATASTWSDAWPALPTIDYSQTGGVPVLPSTFGAWQGANGQGEFYNTIWAPTGIAPPQTLTIVTPTTQHASAGFAVTGGLANYTTAPTLNYAVSTTVPTPTATPGVGSFVDSSGNTWSISSVANGSQITEVVNGVATIIPGGGGTGEIAYYNNTVYAQDATTLAWYTYTAANGYQATTAPPTTTTGPGTFAALPSGATVTSTTFSFTCPGQAVGSYSITVRDANNTSVTVATGLFSVVAGVTPVITPSAPSFPATGLPFTQSGGLPTMRQRRA